MCAKGKVREFDTERKLREIRSLDEIPEGMTEDEAADFFSKRSLGLVLDKMESVDTEVPDNEASDASVATQGSMQVFLMHIGSPGNIDVKYTVTQKRHRNELLRELTPGSDEEKFFGGDAQFLSAFPNGEFNCWGIPPGAKARIRDTRIGDLVLFFPTAGHNGALKYIGIVKAKCDFECWESSRILWPDTPDQRLFPYLFFFDTEEGDRYWFDFLDDIGYSHDFDPRGFYRRIGESRFRKGGGPAGYLNFLRYKAGFRPI